MKATSCLALLLAFCLLSAPIPSLAQADRGAIKGEVLDPQKAIVTGALITLKNEATGVVTSATSGPAGEFNFFNLSPGVYTLTTEAKGFSTSKQEHVAVDVGRTLALTVSLQTGQVHETVSVSANAAAVDSQTSDIGTVVTPREIKDLPVPLSANDMRNPLSFVLLTPGVTSALPGPTQDYRLHISGSVSGANEVYIDGIPIANANLAGNIADNHPPIDAISEFKLVNNNQSAQYGLSSGSVSFAFKSGTNAYHGSLFEFLQNDALNAAGSTFNALRARTDCTVTPQPVGCKKSPLRQHEFGGTFGGPVWIPKLYNGRDKTFFFVDFTDFKYRPSAVNGSLTTIPNAFRTGDFSQVLGAPLMSGGQPILDPAGRPILQGAIYDPFSVHTVIGPDGNAYQIRDPFPGNIIPANFPGLSRVSQNILPFFPMATSGAVFNNLVRQQSSKRDQYRLVVKIDEHLSEKHYVAGSVFTGNATDTNNGTLNLLNGASNTAPTKQIRFTYNYTHSPTLANNFNIGFLRDTAFHGTVQPGPGLDALGITGLPALAPDSPFPIIGLGSFTGIGVGGASTSAENRFIESDNLTMLRGKHTFTLGGELRRIQRNNIAIPGGSFIFDPTQTALNGVGFINGNQAVSIPGGTGNPVASFLFGGMDFSHFDYPIPQYYRWWQTGFYFQDDWRVRSDLTLNLGLRYDIQVPRTEVNGNVSSMDPTLPNPAAGGVLGAYTFYGDGPGRNGKPRIGDIHYLGFQPRIGFAYSPGAHRSVFRGGFAVTRPLGNDNLQGDFTGGYNAGFAGLANVIRPGDAVGSPAYFWDNPYPGGASSANLSPGILTGRANPILISSKVGLPPTQLYWTAQIQHQVTNSMVANIGYVGMHTYHLGNWSKPNQLDPIATQQRWGPVAAAAGLPLNEFLALPISDPRVIAAGITPPFPEFVSLFGPDAPVSQVLRPFPQYGSVDRPLDPIASVSYNALQTSLQKRFSKGLTFLLSYTFSKTIGNVDSNSGPFAGAENAVFAGSFFQDHYNADAQRSVTSSDIPHVVALSYTYELPLGPGKPFLNQNGALGKIVGGWSVSGIHKYQSGRPIHIEYDAFGSSNPFQAHDGFSFRPNIVPGQPFKNPAYSPSCSGPVQTTAGRDPCQFYINPAAFVAPPPGEFGNAPNFISSLRMPAYLNEDFSISKRIPLYESVNLQFQANFFNAFNRVVFSSSPGGGPPTNPLTFIFNGAPPDLSPASLTSSNTVFGILTAQGNGARIIQFALKLEF